MKVSILLSVLTVFLSFPASARSFFPSALISADWLSENLSQVLVLDIREDLDSFTTLGHIPGAILVDVNNIRMDRELEGKVVSRMRPDPVIFQAFMRVHGISEDSKVVLTHRGESADHVSGATRLYWHLKYYNFEHVAILDGGNRAWVEALEDLVKEPTDVTPGNYEVTSYNENILATMEMVQKAMTDGETQLVDTRDMRYHLGIDTVNYVYADGHIPGSLMLPYQLLNPQNGTAYFYDKDKLEAIADAMWLDPNKPMIVYCNSGFEATSVWFVLHELVGNKRARVYDASLTQWTQYPDNPMSKRALK